MNIPLGAGGPSISVQCTVELNCGEILVTRSQGSPGGCLGNGALLLKLVRGSCKP